MMTAAAEAGVAAAEAAAKFLAAQQAALVYAEAQGALDACLLEVSQNPGGNGM